MSKHADKPAGRTPTIAQPAANAHARACVHHMTAMNKAGQEAQRSAHAAEDSGPGLHGWALLQAPDAGFQRSFLCYLIHLTKLQHFAAPT